MQKKLRSAGGGLGGNQCRNFNLNLCALAFLATDVHLELVAVEQTQALMNIADPYAAAVHLGEALRRNAHTVICNLDGEAPLVMMSADVNLAALEARCQAMFDRVLNHGLQQHAGD